MCAPGAFAEGVSESSRRCVEGQRQGRRHHSGVGPECVLGEHEWLEAAQAFQVLLGAREPQGFLLSVHLNLPGTGPVVLGRLPTVLSTKQTCARDLLGLFRFVPLSLLVSPPGSAHGQGPSAH